MTNVYLYNFVQANFIDNTAVPNLVQTLSVPLALQLPIVSAINNSHVGYVATIQPYSTNFLKELNHDS